MNEGWSIQQLAEHLKDEVKGHYLAGGYQIADFDFVGIVENSAEDNIRFEAWLKTIQSDPASRCSKDSFLSRFRQMWRKESNHANQTSSKETVPENVRQEITDIMRDEIELYHGALEHRISASVA